MAASKGSAAKRSKKRGPDSAQNTIVKKRKGSEPEAARKTSKKRKQDDPVEAVANVSDSLNSKRNKASEIKIGAEDEDFPRGGARSTLTAAEVEEARAEAEAEFTKELKRSETGKQDNMFADPDLLSLAGNAPSAVGVFKLKSLTAGVRMWGVVSDVNMTDISISLPNGLHGFVKAEEALPDVLPDVSNVQDAMQNQIHSLLKERFHIGLQVACVVLDIEETRGEDDKKQPKRVVLSLLPKHFNDGVSIDSICTGQLMVAFVKSVEDHGYILSFGVPKVSGFLLHKDLDGDEKLQSGKILLGSVSAVDGKRGVVNLSMKTSSNMKEHDNLTFGNLLPGALVKARVQAVLRNGLLLSFLTYFTGTVDIFHLESDFPGKQWPEEYSEGKQVRGRILFIDTKSKSIRLSLRAHILEKSLIVPPVNIGDSFNEAVIKRVDPMSGLLLDLPAKPSVPGYVNLSHVSEEKIEKIEKKFREGQKVKARVIGFRLMDGMATVSMKDSVLKGVVNKLDLRAAMVVHGVVTNLEPFGAFVSLGGKDVKALCPLQQMSEFQRLKPSAKFKVGAQLKFRILQLQNKKLTVTHKKTMVSSKLPPITSFDDAVEGLVTHGWIQGVHASFGCFVEFYNHVKGLVHKSELGISSSTPIESVFQVGQVVKCRVLQVQPNTQKLSLSFILRPELLEINLKPGSIVSAKLTKPGQHEMELQVSSSEGEIVAIMAYYHLSDTPEHVERMKSLLKPGFVFERLLVLENRGSTLVLSAKHSLLEAAESLPSSASQLLPQQVVPGFITAINERSCVVQFLGELMGIVHKRDVADTFVEDISKVIQVGQSVRSQVLKVDLENGKCLLSLKQSSCFSTDASLIEGYFLEEEKIAELKQTESAPVDWAQSLPIGEVIEAEAQEVKDYGIIFSIKDNADAVGFATHYQSDGSVKPGTKVKAAILDVVKADGIVDLSLQKKMLTSLSGKKQTFQLHQKVQAVVELVKDEYLVLSLPDYDNAIGYASTRDYNLRMLRPHDLFYSGQRLMTTIFKVNGVGGRVLLLVADSLAPKPPKPARNYEIGSWVEGQVVDIQSLAMTVEVGRSIRGRVHVTEVTNEYEEGNPFKKFRFGQTVKAKILSKKTKQTPVALELSLRLSETAGVITFETLSSAQKVLGYVQEVTDEWVWLLLSRRVRGRLFILHTFDNPLELQHFKERFKVGDAVHCYVAKVDHAKRTLDLSMRPVSFAPDGREQISKGDIAPGRISKVFEGVGGLAVQLGPNIFGRIHVTHLGDEWLDNPAALFAVGMFVRCKVLDVRSSADGKTAYDLSLRPSLGGSGGFESLPSFQQQLHRDVSPRIDSIKDVKPNTEVQGFVKSVSEKGCFLTLAPDVDGRVLLKHLSDSYVANPSECFPKGKLVTARVLSVEPLSGRAELTMGSHTTVSTKGIREIHVGDFVLGNIRSIEKYGIFVTIAGSDIAGLCHVSEVSDDFIPEISAVYKVGQKVQAKVLKVDVTKNRIALGMKESYLVDNMNEEESEETEDAEEERMQEVGEVDEDDEVDNDVMVVDPSAEPLQVNFDEVLEEPMPVEDEKPSSEVTKKKSKKEKRLREVEIRAAEERLLQTDQPPETVDDFERLVRASPNSSFVWIKYMAFWLRLADAEKARAVAERALETINYREETEKLNIWTAYLNLENTCGISPKENVSAIFERALKFCDPKKLHLALLGIYENSNQHELTDALMRAMTRKFKTSAKVWHKHLSNLLSRNLEDKARKAFDQALQGLHRHKHIKFISAAAVLEFKSGSAERARDIFDGVLRNYPKRTDLWSVYIDQEIRLGDVPAIRDLFERATCLDLPPKKMKFLFKKYLDFEKSQGDESRIEHVKTKAMEYVESRGG